MSRLKIELPATFSFETVIPVRITDINYGGHVGNDTVLSILHEARVRFLVHHGFSELDIGGPGLIMSDVAIQFKSELFYGDHLQVSVAATDFSKVSFTVCYLVETEREAKRVTVVTARSGMLAFDYGKKKITAVPEGFREKVGF